VTCRIGLISIAIAAVVAAGDAAGRSQAPDRTARLREQLKQVQASEPDRDRTHQHDKALDSLGLRPGMIVAEVGAGPGFIVEKLARRVGPGGKVFAEDITARMLELLKLRMADRQLTNYETILGTETDPKLPAGSLDMVVICTTMHMVEAPVELLRNIRPSLKPRGRLVLIEPVRGQAADPQGRPISESGFRTREAFLDVFSKASFDVERIDAAIIPYDTIFVLTPAKRRPGGAGGSRRPASSS
jgi:SAM-dependent methyltransferase